MKFIPYGHQTIDEDDINAVIKVLRGDWLTQGPSVSEFEEAVAEYIGVKYAVAFCNGTAALHGAYYAAGLTQGDEIITSPITFAATSNAAVYLGANPVFADISWDNYCLDPAKVLEKINDKVKIISPVSYAGYPVDIKSFREITEKNGAVLIEDACHALGAERNGVKVGKEADMTVFSFHPVKHITTGEGGMVVTDKPEFAQKLRLFRTHGITKNTALMTKEPDGPWYHEMLDLGYNYRITDLQCALGLSQFRKLDSFVKRRREIADIYNKEFSEIQGVRPAPEHLGHSYHLYPVFVEPVKRKELFVKLRENNIGVQVHYIPVHLQPYYRKTFNYKQGDYPLAEKYYSGEISLPMFPSLKIDEISYILSFFSKTI